VKLPEPAGTVLGEIDAMDGKLLAAKGRVTATTTATIRMSRVARMSASPNEIAFLQG
jgi:hypothetical protein